MKLGVAMPFCESKTSTVVPQPSLRQIDVKNFKLLTPFVYRDPTDGNRPYFVHSQARNASTTDLASVPSLLWGLIAPYGHQTLPALLHDQLCDVAAAMKKRSGNKRALVIRTNANRLFLVSLAEQQVPWTRRWMMWAAVELAGLASYAKRRFFAVLALTLSGLYCSLGWPMGHFFDLAWWDFTGWYRLLALVPAALGLAKPAWFAIAAIGSYALLPVAVVLIVVGLATGLIWLIPSGFWWSLKKVLPRVEAGPIPIFGPTALLVRSDPTERLTGVRLSPPG